MRVLLDTNVVLDIMLRRAPWLADAEVIWEANQRGQLTGYITASSFTDIYYIAHKLIGRDAARRVLRVCLEGLQVVAVDERLLEQALSLTGPDFEDDLQMAAAAAVRLDAIVTRDAGGFADSLISVLSPSELISKLKA